MDTDKTNMEEKIPESFIRGLDDLNNVRVVDMETVIKFDPEEWGPFTLTEDQVRPHKIRADADYTIRFYNKENKVAGTFDFNGDKLKFEGDPYESAQVFIDFVLRMFNQRIDQIKGEAALEGAETILKECKEGYENGYKEGYENGYEDGQIDS